MPTWTKRETGHYARYFAANHGPAMLLEVTKEGRTWAAWHNEGPGALVMIADGFRTMAAAQEAATAWAREQDKPVPADPVPAEATPVPVRVSRQVRRAEERRAHKAATRPGPFLPGRARSLSAAAVKIDADLVGPDGPGQHFGPFLVRILYDDSPGNPWEAWDCMTPLAVAGGAGLDVYDSGDDILDPFSHMTPEHVETHAAAIAAAFGWRAEAFAADLADHAARYGDGIAAARVDLFREALAEERSQRRPEKFLDLLAELYAVAGLPHLRTRRSGYCQGHTAEVLLVVTAQHAARCGFDLAERGDDLAESLVVEADLWGHYVFGDCYGFAIEDENGGHVESCFGFYGPYYDDGADVIAEAESALGHALRERIGVALNAEYAARGDFLALRSETRRGPRFGPAIRAALHAEALALAWRWTDARATRRQCAALLAAT